MAILLNGTALADKIKANLKKQILELTPKPTLAVILVGNNPASHIYVHFKKKAAESIGVEVQLFHLDANISANEIASLIHLLNKDPKVNGILMQLPLPPHLDEFFLVSLISPDKDVDGLTPLNQGKLFLGTPNFVPCTPLGVMNLIQSWKSNIEGLHAVVLGRSKLVGKPLALLLLQAGATVTIAHSKTKELSKIACKADILVAAVGRRHLVTGEWIKPGACVIDVGITKAEVEGVGQKIYGDVDFDSASKIAGAITPMPGGVGPMTIAYLLQNVLKAYKAQHFSGEGH